MSKIISSDMAAYLIPDNAVVVPGGFGCCGHPEAITKAIERRYRATAMPKGLTLLFAAGPGDRHKKGINRLSAPGLVARAFGGYWGFIPDLGAAALNGTIEAHNWPQGVISKLFRSIAAGDEGLLSTVGVGTFIDPRIEGGCLNNNTKPVVELLEFMGTDKLFYPALPIDFAYVRASTADEDGNLTMEDEVSLQDTLAQAQAAHNSGGTVVAQVKRVVKSGVLDPHMVKVPGALVDYIVVADNDDDHSQTYAVHYNPGYVSAGSGSVSAPKKACNLARDLIVKRAAMELLSIDSERTPIINLGIGIPSELGKYVTGAKVIKPILTVEGGAFGGNPAYGLSFGASEFPDAIIDQNSLFDLYDGGGIDMAFLGFAQVDHHGNVNASKFNGKMFGVGGFVNISQSAKKIIFCGTFTAGGLDVSLNDDSGELSVIREGKHKKFVNKIEQISFNGQLACANNKVVKFITERAVFELQQGKLILTETFSGIDIERDILRYIDFPLHVCGDGVSVIQA